MRTSVKCVVGHKSGKCGRKRPTQQRQNTGEREAAWAFDFYTPDVLRSPAAAWLPLVQDGSVGLGTKVARGTELERKRLLGPPPPAFCGTPTGSPPKFSAGQNQVKIRSRPDFDPISIRFRPDFDPISTRFRPDVDFRPDLDPISTRFRPDFEKGLFWGPVSRPGSGPDAANGPDCDPSRTRFRPKAIPTRFQSDFDLMWGIKLLLALD